MTYRDAGFLVLLKSLDFLTTENLEISHNINQEWIWKTCSQGMEMAMFVFCKKLIFVIRYI